MSEVRGSTGSRGNPPPRPALSRVRPLEAEDGPGAATDTGASPDTAAAAPGGTEGRDLLIPGPAKPTGKAHGRTKSGRPVPSLADLMPPAAPSGRRQGAPSAAHHHKADHGKSGDKGGKSAELSVRLSKSVRKRLRTRAAELGLSPEDTVAQLVEVWLEG